MKTPLSCNYMYHCTIILAIIVVTFIHLSTGGGPVTWNDCTGNMSSITKIEKMNITPAADVWPGEWFTLNFTFLLNEVLNGGKVRVDVQYGVLHYATDEYDLCSKFKLKCPLNKGIQHGLFEGQVPFPNGQFIFTINGTSTEGKEVSCFTVKMNNL